ncbi:hypothetical protein AYK20_05700 [Thermoplasmatales archaeon SG8-52-1]|nr:MAG: hypothetical protein AYK20_05700 [Thermoplasmatales archaeon SG8-52-1]
MKNTSLRKGLVLGIIVLFIGMSLSPISGLKNKNSLQISSDLYKNMEDCVINITVYEAWELLNDTSNGIQIPIDIRSDEQWNEGFIDTPYPENPVHIWNGSVTNFSNKFDGKEIIIYCEGGYRSLVLSYLICCENFTGIIYHWSGGIIEWIEAGLPIRNNTAPQAPTVKGKVMIHDPGPYNYKFKATDPENDYVRYIIYWGDGTWEWTDYNASGEEIIVSHIWDKAGSAIVKSRANDTYGALGPEGFLEWSKVGNNKIISDSQEGCGCDDNSPNNYPILYDILDNRLTYLTDKLIYYLESMYYAETEEEAWLFLLLLSSTYVHAEFLYHIYKNVLKCDKLEYQPKQLNE